MGKSGTVVLSSIVEEVSNERGFQTTSFTLTGEPHAAALMDAVLTDYHHVTGRPKVTEEMLRSHVGRSVSLLRSGESAFGAGSIQTTQGTIFEGRGGAIAYLPKGARKNGIRLNPDGVLDVEVGYNKEDVLAGRVKAVVDMFPRLEPLTLERLRALPETAPQPAQIGLVVFGTWPGPGGRSAGAIWCLHSYMHEDDIAEGYLILRPEAGTSEHGSIYGQQLLRFTVGRVVNPPALSFAEAMDLGDLDYHEALAQIVGA